MKKILVVGAGFAGATIARILHDTGKYEVTVMDERYFPGGNAIDFTDYTGIRRHEYGPHLFHTNNKRVFDFLSNYTEWYDYKHKVKALYNGTYYTLPVNRIVKEKLGADNIVDIFFRPYTEKMWGKPLEEVNPKILERVPIRDDDNELYFPNDEYQCLPKHGYVALFKNLLAGIPTVLGKRADHAHQAYADHVFTSQSIDEYYSFIYGHLPYRSLIMHHHWIEYPRNMLPAPTINFTTTTGPTRVTEWKQLMEEPSFRHTILTFETPCEYRPTGHYQRYYPIQTPENQALYDKYKAIENDRVTFIGRCGTYQYLDMHQVVNQSMQIAEKFIRSEGEKFGQ